MPLTSKVLSMSTDGNLHPGMFNLLGRIFAHELTNRVWTLQLTVRWNHLVEPALEGEFLGAQEASPVPMRHDTDPQDHE
ncbi:hypothetical protein LINPERHAP2_LOCUS35665 [Linum perenne]